MDKHEVLRESQRRVLDEDARQRRLRKALDLLEQDNHMEEPPSDARTTKRPKFGDDISTDCKTKKKRRSIVCRAKFKKTLEILLDEEFQATKGGQVGASYFSIATPRSRLPPRKFCNVCGFPGLYTCVTCGVRFCSSRCRDVHNDTRCLKWVA